MYSFTIWRLLWCFSTKERIPCSPLWEEVKEVHVLIWISTRTYDDKYTYLWRQVHVLFSIGGIFADYHKNLFVCILYSTKDTLHYASMLISANEGKPVQTHPFLVWRFQGEWLLTSILLHLLSLHGWFAWLLPSRSCILQTNQAEHQGLHDWLWSWWAKPGIHSM